MTVTNTAVPTFPTSAGELPAFVFPADHELSVADAIEVGQIVAFHTRGRYRAAQVVKVTPKRVEAIYTTQGAHDEAVKIAQIDYVARVHGERQHAENIAAEYRAKADAIDAGTIEPGERTSGCLLAFLKTDEERQAEIAKWRATYPTQLREWAANSEARADREGDYFMKALAEAEAKNAVPFEQRVAEATHVTTKNVKRLDVFAVEVSA